MYSISVLDILINLYDLYIILLYYYMINIIEKGKSGTFGCLLFVFMFYVRQL